MSNVNALSDAEVATYQNDYNACAESSDVSDDATLDVTDNMLTAAWEREKQAWQCLSDAGFQVAEVPSRRVYIDTFRAGEQYTTWGSLMLDEAVTSADMTRLTTLCPDPMQWFGEE